MKVNEFHPYGRFLKAMRIVNRIQDHCEEISIKEDLDLDTLYKDYAYALKHPVHPKSAKMLNEFLDPENSWPSGTTLTMAAELITEWEISIIDRKH